MKAGNERRGRSAAARAAAARGSGSQEESQGSRRRRGRKRRRADATRSTASTANTSQIGGALEVSCRRARAGSTADQYQSVSEPTVSWSTPAQAARAASQSPSDRSELVHAPVPEIFDVEKGERISQLLPEQGRVEQEDRRSEREPADVEPARGSLARRAAARAGRRANPSGRVRSASPATSAAPGVAALLGEQERGHAEDEEERFAVDRLEEKGHRKDGQEHHTQPRLPIVAEQLTRQPIEELERDQRHARSDDEHSGENVVAAEEAPDDCDQGWIERVEGRRALVAGRRSRPRR